MQGKWEEVGKSAKLSYIGPAADLSRPSRCSWRVIALMFGEVFGRQIAQVFISNMGKPDTLSVGRVFGAGERRKHTFGVKWGRGK